MCTRKNVYRKNVYKICTYFFFVFSGLAARAVLLRDLLPEGTRGRSPRVIFFIFRGCKIYGHSISIHEIFLSFFQNARAIYAATKQIKICLLFPFYLLSSLKFYIFFLYYYFFYLLLYILNQCDNTVYKQNYIFT